MTCSPVLSTKKTLSPILDTPTFIYFLISIVAFVPTIKTLPSPQLESASGVNQSTLTYPVAPLERETTAWPKSEK